ncbi:MAG: FtsX-like permease family protein [Campylobacterota bacterium]|nr:FtsX-like permease family protein [Campylobacterota bacterium]
MPGNVFFNFLFLLIYRHRTKHMAVFVIATLVVMLFSSVMLLSHAIEEDIKVSLDTQPDFIVQKMHAGKAVDTPMEWADEIREIRGVSAVLPRVYGSYFYAPNEEYFTIVGIDPFDKQVSTSLEALVGETDLKEFLSKEQMIIGQGVKTLLEQYHYFDHYLFRSPDSTKVRVDIYKTLPKESTLVSNDMMIMEIDLAKQVLGIDDEASTDIVLFVPNELERQNVKEKIILQHADLRVIEKDELASAYEHLFNYKGGVFLLLYMIVLITFVLILYQRYSMISSADKKEIGILRALGWSINAVIWLKIMESLVVGLSAFMLGLLLAYGYVFLLDAPLLAEVFLGYGNLSADIVFNRTIDIGVISLLFLFFIMPYVAAVLVPVWRIAITDPVEAMK